MVSLLTLFSIFKVWVSVFWSPAIAAAEPDEVPAKAPPDGSPA